MSALSSSPATQFPIADSVKAASQLHQAQNKKAVHDAAVKFEAMFMQEMMVHMFSGIKTDGEFGGGHGEEVFRSLMVEEYGKKIAASGQTGIAQTLEAEMLRMQEEQLNPRGIIRTSQLEG